MVKSQQTSVEFCMLQFEENQKTHTGNMTEINYGIAVTLDLLNPKASQLIFVQDASMTNV